MRQMLLFEKKLQIKKSVFKKVRPENNTVCQSDEIEIYLLNYRLCI